MEPEFLEHLTETTLENYALGRLPEEQLEPVETHLLICAVCQDALTAADDYVAAMRAALAEPVPEPLPSRWEAFTGLLVDRRRYPRHLPAFAAALGALSLALVLSRTPGWEARLAPEIVTLRSERGGVFNADAEGPAESRLRLRIQSQHLRVDHQFEARIVDAAGNPVWAGAPRFNHDDGYLLHVDTPLGAGSYWVRLYSSEARLLQEYGLQLK